MHHCLLRAFLLVTVHHKLKCGDTKVWKHVDVFKLKYPERLQEYKAAVQAINISDNSVPTLKEKKAAYDMVYFSGG